jgi:hypothetical protein
MSMKTIIEILRHELETCKKTRYRIFKETGVDQSVLFRIARGGDCKSETVDALLRYFGYEIRKRKG